MKHADKIFGAFQRLHGQDKYEGTGMGLAACKKIAGQHGGQVWVEPAPGEGSTFYFSAPAAGRALAGPLAPEPQKVELTGNPSERS